MNITVNCQTQIDQRLIVVLDPMLATGGSAIAAINFIKRAWWKEY